MLLWQPLGHMQGHAGCRTQLTRGAPARNPLQAASWRTHTHTNEKKPLPWLLSFAIPLPLWLSIAPIPALPGLVHLAFRLLHQWWAARRPLACLLIHEQKRARRRGAFWLCCRLLGVAVSRVGHRFFSTRAALGRAGRRGERTRSPVLAREQGRGRPCRSGSASPVPEHSILKQLRKALLNAGILRGNMNVRIQHSSIRGEK